MKIDVVFTWVDGSDPEWIKKKDNALREAGRLSEKAIDKSRWDNKDELKYALRSIHKNMRWVNNIYIVTDSQKPSWLDETHPRIFMVPHADIFPDNEVLPVFNSRAIEACLHKIHGLSDIFIYFNDDMFVCRKTPRGYFVMEDGRLKSWAMKKQPIQAGDVDRYKHDSYVSAGVNAANLIREKWCFNTLYRMAHAPYVARKELMESLERDYIEQFDATRKERFRSYRDIPPISFFYPWYYHFSGEQEVEVIRRFSSVSNTVTLSRWRSILKLPYLVLISPRFLNFNDGKGGVPHVLRGVIAKVALSLLFFRRAPWER
ncbi:Stealth CR1 domain-containing protein [Halomonas heilongjiangensis]|uniref:Capsular polysaccharide phosphotransferase SacB n=1 Tax=Halomonas heilongjiangensis TaxID=1387883 RepID=A0A2N7TUM6_9GAMM|nr:Stealth CR1 domain-containing protein [Halomonas heilongjiangensis]PMR71858.1 hypothetical protein C1H66_01045 [Halomonas heilongjiangensis]PXX87679.1 hypothetical protein CR158_17910 [Halomonas heilongjiangensis]